jgi:histidine ammonia-lyase
MACDVALTASRRVRLAERIFALSIEASECPAGHFDRRLADRWLDPFYKQSLDRFHALLCDSTRRQLQHQAPTSWRVLPNVLAASLRALSEVSHCAQIGLQSLKDNPTFLRSDASPDEDLVVSGGGYHDHGAAKAIDQMNSVLMDLCVLASRQVGHLLDGVALGLPALLARPGDGVGLEYLAWGMTEPLTSARRAAEATTLDAGLQDPAGNQSDIASLGLIAYVKHRTVASTFDACFATLALTAALALEFREAPLPGALRPLGNRVATIAKSGKRAHTAGEPLRRLHAMLRASCEQMTSREYAEFAASQ